MFRRRDVTLMPRPPEQSRYRPPPALPLGSTQKPLLVVPISSLCFPAACPHRGRTCASVPSPDQQARGLAQTGHGGFDPPPPACRGLQSMAPKRKHEHGRRQDDRRWQAGDRCLHGKQAEGSVKAGAGTVLGDSKLVADGKADKVEGKVQNAIGGVKDALKK